MIILIIDITQIIQYYEDMKFILNGTKDIYKEIADEIKKQISIGIYKEGDILPSCRKMGLELKVNPNTVKKAYDQLISEDVVTALPKKGYFVKKNYCGDVTLDARKAIRFLYDDLHLTSEEIIKLVREEEHARDK